MSLNDMQGAHEQAAGVVRMMIYAVCAITCLKAELLAQIPAAACDSKDMSNDEAQLFVLACQLHVLLT